MYLICQGQGTVRVALLHTLMLVNYLVAPLAGLMADRKISPQTTLMLVHYLVAPAQAALAGLTWLTGRYLHKHEAYCQHYMRHMMVRGESRICGKATTRAHMMCCSTVTTVSAHNTDGMNMWGSLGGIQEQTA
jgi:hypothetical protein